jgi:hypothetical protein
MLRQLYSRRKCLYLKVKNKDAVLRTCDHGMESPGVADGGDGLQIWRAAVNILNKYSRTTDKG